MTEQEEKEEETCSEDDQESETEEGETETIEEEITEAETDLKEDQDNFVFLDPKLQIKEVEEEIVRNEEKLGPKIHYRPQRQTKDKSVMSTMSRCSVGISRNTVHYTGLVLVLLGFSISDLE